MILLAVKILTFELLFLNSGRRAISLRSGGLTLGESSFSFPAASLPSGTYTIISKLNGVQLGEGMKIIRTR